MSRNNMTLSALKPIGAIRGDLDGLANAIRVRAVGRGRRCQQTLVFVDPSSGLVYAPNNDGAVAARQGAATIVGVYTGRAKTAEVREDLEAWRAAA